MQWQPPRFDKYAPQDSYGWARQCSRQSKYVCSVCNGHIDRKARACGCIMTHLVCEKCPTLAVDCRSDAWVEIGMPAKPAVRIMANPNELGDLMLQSIKRIHGIEYGVNEVCDDRSWHLVEHGGQTPTILSIVADVSDVQDAPLGIIFESAPHTMTGVRVRSVDRERGGKNLNVGDVVVAINGKSVRGVTARHASSILVAELWAKDGIVDIHRFERAEQRGSIINLIKQPEKCIGIVVHAVQEIKDSLLLCAMLFKSLGITEKNGSRNIGGSVEVCYKWTLKDGVNHNTHRIVLCIDGCKAHEIVKALNGCTAVVLTKAHSRKVATEIGAAACYMATWND